MSDSASAPKWDGWRASVPQRTVRTTLRELRKSDAGFLAPLFLDADVQRFAPGLPGTLEAVERYVAWAERNSNEGRHVCLAVELDAQVIGVIHAWPLEPTAQTVEWGFILRRTYWGRGLFQEAAGAFVSSAVLQLGVQRLEARTAVTNERGVAALTRLGAHREGTLRQAFALSEGRVDCWMWSILAAEWRLKHSRPYSLDVEPGANAVPVKVRFAVGASAPSEPAS